MKKNFVFLIPAIFVLAALLLPVVAAPPSAQAEPVKHQVVKGDDLHLLAGYYFRNPRLWREIYGANKNVIRKPSLLIPGMTLTIPEQHLKTFPAEYAEWRGKVRK